MSFNMKDWGEIIVFDSAVLDSPPASSHYTVWINGRENEPLSVYFDPSAYAHGVCGECRNEKCWIAEPVCLLEFLNSHPDMVYEHACCCACHDTESGGVSEGSDYDNDDEEADPTYRPN